jgi:predicted Zn-dependent peptidase
MINLKITEGSFMGVEKIELKQGINLNFIKTDKFKTNLICVLLTVPLERKTVTQNALIPFLLKRGTEKYKTQEEITKRLDDLYGTSFDCGIDKIGDNQVFKFYVEPIRDEYVDEQTNLTEEAIDLLLEIVFNPFLENGYFKEEFLKTEKERLKKVIESKIDDKDSYALENCLNSMYNDEGFGLYKFGKLEDIDSITKESITEQYLNLIQTAKIDIFISGNIDKDDIKNRISKNVNMEKLIPRIENYKLNNEFTEIKQKVDNPKEIQESMNITQGKLVIGMDVLSKQKNLRCVALVYNAILGDGANSMLFQNVREKASLAYTAKSSFVKPKLNIFIRCGIEIENYDKALNIIKEQLKNIEEGNFSDEDILNAKKYLIAGIKAISEEQDTEVVYYIGQEIAKTFTELEKYMENINLVTKEEIIEFAKQVQTNTIYFLKN